MAHVLASAVTMHSHHGCSLPRKVLEFAESLLAHLPEVEEGSGLLLRSWSTNGHMLCGSARATSPMNIGQNRLLDRVRPPAVKEQRWSEENLRETTEGQDDACRAS